MYTVRAQAQAPERLLLRVANADIAAEPLDFSTVTAVALEVVAPWGERLNWPATITGQDASSITFQHLWSIDDVWVPGVYRLSALLTAPAGTRRTGLSALNVVP